MRLQVNWTGLWQEWLGRWTETESRRAREEERTLRQEMEAARQETEAAERYFQTVTDPELVDHAIYTMEAARRKYVYLYRRLRHSRGGAVGIDQGGSEWM